MPPSSSKPAAGRQQPGAGAGQSMSQYLHGTLRGLVELPALPHNSRESDGGAAAANATGPTVAERINLCDAYGRYAAGDFAGSGDDDGAGADASSNDSKEKRKAKGGMMAHGAVDGYLDLHPGGVAAASHSGDASDTSSAANPPTAAAQMSAAQPAGGLVLPPLDWNASFRKGYSVQMWVRPHLCRRSRADGDGEECCRGDNNDNNSSKEQQSQDGGEGGGGAAILPPDARPGALSAAAARGRSAALESPERKQEQREREQRSQSQSGSIPDGPASAAAEAAAEALRQAEVDRPRVLYRFATAPDNERGVGVCALLGKWTAHERPTSSTAAASEEGAGDDPDNDTDTETDARDRDITHLQTTLTVYSLPHHKSNPVFFVPSSSGRGERGFAKSDDEHGAVAGWDSPEKARRKDGGGAEAGSFDYDDDDDGFPNSGSGGGGNLHDANMQRFEQQQQVLHRTQDAASLATATLVLPSDEWSLVGINHVMPYLKRPQISICVNGDQVLKAELGYPQLDPAHSATASAAAASSSGNDLATPRGSGGGSGGQGRASPSLGFRAGGAGGMTQVLKQAEELPPGWMGHCTVLDNTFGFGGVQVKGAKAAHAPYHMHVASLALYSEPISSTVQAIVAEFGPNAPPGMVMPPVPCVVQNRDSVVTDGHHSGHSSGSSGRGGSGGGIAVGRGHKSGRSIGLATSIGVLPPSGHGRESLRVNIDGGGELNLQKAIGKCVLGWSFADAVSLGNDKVPSTPSGSSESLSSKAGSHGSGAVGPGRLVCPPSRYNASIGKADDVPKVGLVQPRPPPSADERSPHGLLGDKGGILGLGIVTAKTGLDVDFPGTGDRRYDGGGVLRTLGTSALWNTTQFFLASEQKRTTEQPDVLVPSAPSPISYHLMYTSCDPLSYFLLPLRLALPPPGHVHNLQGKLYRESFWHLQALLVTSNNVKGSEGALLAAIIRNLASSLRLGGRCRDDVLQSGAIYTLSTLVRRVLLRGYKLGLLGGDHGVAEDKISRAVMEDDSDVKDDVGGNAKLREYDDALDGISHDECRPPIIPPLVADASVDLIDACCGPIWLDWHGQGIGSSGKSSSNKSSSKRGGNISPRRKMERRSSADGRKEMRSSDREVVAKNAVIPASLHVRRSSDISQSALFGFALDFDLWGSDPNASAKILKAVALRFCSNGPGVDYAGGTIAEAPADGKGGYGWLLRNQMSVQTFLDAIRLGFSGGAALSEPMISTANALAAILKSMLHHSLSSHRSISRGEHDVAACVHALTDVPFGSITSHVVLTSIADMLSDSGAIRNYETRELKEGKKHRLELTSRLGRNLLMSSFHDAVAPMLLGRTVFRGGDTPEREPGSPPGDEKSSIGLNWTHHWQLCLLIFSWISSVAGPEGEVAAKTTGAILDASSSAGSLDGALVVGQDVDGEKQRAFVESLCFPPLPQASHSTIGSDGTTSVHDNATAGMDDYLKDLSHRLRCLLYLLPGLVQSLTSGVSPGQTIDRTSATIISALLTSVSVSFKQIGLEASNVRVDEKLTPKAAQLALKAASQAIPPLIKLCALLETPINEMQNDSTLPVEPRLRTDSADTNTTGASGSVVLVSHSDASLQLPEKQDGEDSLTKLRTCQEALLDQSAGLLIDAMLAGAPAATKVLSLAINAAKPGGIDTIGETETAGTMVMSNNLLCRISSKVLLKIVKANKDTSSPWSNSALCGSVARVIDLVEEKYLLKVPAREVQVDQKFTPDQIRLLCSLMQVLSQGRRSSGWVQINTSSDNDKSNDPEGGDKQVEEESLADRITRYIDESLIQHEYQLYMEDWRDDEDDASPAHDNGLASVLLLPVLQPCLRATLEAASIVSAADSIYTNPSRRNSIAADGASNDDNNPDNSFSTGPLKLSVLSALMHEIDSTLDAAIAGLVFPSARDQFLAATSSLRKAVVAHENAGDSKSAELCKAVLLSVTKSLEVRYKASNHEESDEPSASSAAVENLMLGDALLGMAHNKYKGFAGAISRAVEKEDCDDALRILAPYLDEWDKALAAEEEESELVEQFDSSTLEEGQRAVVANSETSADALDTYASLSTNESSRLTETKLIMTSSRSKRLAFSDRNIFRSWLEIFTDQGQWERCQSDGGRDYGSRIATVPIAPQFKRYVPPWLDHTITTNTEEDGTPIKAAKDDNQDNDYEFISASTKALEGVAIRDVTKEGMAEPKIGEEGDVGMDSDQHDDPVSQTLSREEHHGDSDSHLSHSSSAADGLDVGFPSKDEPKYRDDEDQTSGLETASTMDSATMESGSDIATLVTTTSEGDSLKQLHKHHHRRTQGASISSFSNPPDGSQAILGSVIYNGESGISQVVEHFYQGCLHVQQAGSRKATLLITSSHLILEYEEAGLFEEEAGHLQETRKRHLEEDDRGTPTSTVSFTPKTDASATSAVAAGDGEHGTVHTEKSNPLYHAVEKHDDTQDDKAAQFEKIERHSTSSAQMRPKTMRWNISELSHIYLRRYRLRDSALEMFLIPTAGELFGSVGLYSSLTSIFIDFGPGYEGNLKRDDAANAIMRRAPVQTVKQWPERSGQFLHEQLRQVTRSWITRRLSNFEYILSLNILAGRSFNDISQYPVFPWVLGGSSYSQEELPDLEDPASYRDLSKPMGAINPTRLKEFKDRFESFQDAGVEIPPFMYGSHYSTAAGVVCYFLLRLHPFSQLHRQLQSGHFDVADRLFASIPRTWEMNTGPSAAEVKELTPEWYCNPAFLKNTNKYKLGCTQDGEEVGDVTLPPWAKGSPEKFIEVMRLALESDICSEGLPDWIDLIFGRKQQGPEAIEADNVFFYLTYYGSVDLQAVDEEVRTSLEDQILHFGSCPMQLFWRPHVKRLPSSSLRTRAFENYVMKESHVIGQTTMSVEALQSMTNAASTPTSSPDTFLKALSTLRSALYAHERNNDAHAATQCRSLIVSLVQKRASHLQQ